MNKEQIIEQMAHIQNSDHPEKVEKLSNLLVDAVLQEDIDLVYMLLQDGAEVDQANGFGSTALMQAAMEGQTKTAELLIANGAKVDQAGIAGDTALMRATRRGNTRRK